MAIEKITETPHGVLLTYHRIVSMNALYAHGVVDVAVGSYLDQDARASGKAPMTVAPQVRLTFENLGTNEPTREAVYAALKALPEYADAEDC